MWIFGCKKEHPIELIELPQGESVTSLKSQDISKVVMRLEGKSSTRVDWDLPLNEKNGGTAWGGEKLFSLEDGRLIYCGHALDPKMISSCWIIEGKKATRIGEPVLKANPTMQESLAKTVGFAANGAWWATSKDMVEFSESRETAAEALELPVPGPYRRTTYSPQTDRFALVTGERETCKLVVISRADMELVDTLPLATCYVNIQWNSDGKTLGILENFTLSLWEPKGERKQLTERGKGPDGRDEELRLVAFSPDSKRVLIRSSRHQKMDHNPMAGVYNAVFDTFVIDIVSGEWKRLPDTGDVALWQKN